MQNFGFDISKTGAALGNYAGAKLAAASDKVSSVQDTANTIIDGIITEIEDEVQSALIGGINKIYESLGINDEALQLANTLLTTASGSIAKLKTILSILPDDVTFSPSPKATLTTLTTSFKDAALSMWKQMLAQYNELTNAVIMQVGQPIEIVVGMVGAIVEYAEKLVDDTIFKYTGYHILEIYNMCIKGYQIIREIQALNKSSVPNAGVSGSLSITVDKDTNKQLLYKQLYDYLEGLSTPLYNAFMMLQIKETVLQVKDFVSKMTNISLEELSRNIQNMDDIVKILDDMLAKKPIQITLAEIIANGMNNITAATQQINKAAETAMDLSMLNSMSTQEITAGAMSMISVKADTYLTYKFEVDEKKSEETGNFYVNITLYEDPSNNIKKITNTLKNVKLETGAVFTSATINNIIKTLKKAWDTPGSIREFEEIGYAGQQQRVYVFNVILKNINDKPKNNQSISGAESNSPNYIISTPSMDDIHYTHRGEYNDGATPLFDIVGSIINSIKPLQGILKTLAHLIENYKINKAKVQSHANVNLGKALLNLLEKQGMKITPPTKPGALPGTTCTTEVIDTRKENFYTVRSKMFMDFLKVEFNLKPDHKSMSYATAEQTNHIMQTAPVNIGLSCVANKPTRFYYDMARIADGSGVQKDGSYNGLPDIIRDPNTNSILVNTSGLSLETSQILLLLQKQEDPF